MKLSRRNLFLASSAVVTVTFSTPSAQAQRYWDNNGSTAGFGTANGTWFGNSTTGNTTGNTTQGWSTSTTGVTVPANYTTLTSDSLNFGNGTLGLATGTITVSGTVSAGNMTFATNSGSITLAGGTINLGANPTFTTANGTSVNTISGNLTGAATALIKAGNGTLVLSGTNSYSGNTSITAGRLQFAKQTSLYGNNTGNWTASKINVGSGGTLSLNVGGSGEFTTGDVTTLLTNLGGVNGTSTTGFAAGSAIGFDTTGATGNFTIGDTIADSTGSGGGAIGVTKLGTGNLTLTANNTYTGNTTVGAGALRLEGTSSSSRFSLTGTLTLATGGNFTGQALTMTGGTLNSANTGAAQTHTFLVGNSTVSNAGQNFTSANGLDSFQVGNITNASGAGGSVTLNPTTANFIISGDYVGITNAGTNGLFLGGTSAGNRFDGNLTLGTRTQINLTKTGASIWTLNGTNTGGNGSTTVSGGALIAAKAASLNSGTVTFSGGTLGVVIGTSPTNWSTSEVDTMLGAATKTSGALGIDTSNGNLTQWTAFTTTNLGSALGLAKLGTGNLTLNNTGNNYTGTTLVNQGTLEMTVDHTLSGGLTFGYAGGTPSATPGTLKLTGANATFGNTTAGGLNVDGNSNSAYGIQIDSGKVLTIGGAVQIGATTPGVSGTVTKLAMTGGGEFVHNGSTFLVGGMNGSVRADATLDLTGLAKATITTSGNFRIAPNTTSNPGGSGTLLLPTPVVADTVLTANITSSGSNGISVGNGGANNGSSTVTSSMNTLQLGTGLTRLNADKINVGSQQVSGAMRDIGQIIYGNVTTGDLMIRGANGTSRVASINIGNGGTTTAQFATSPNLFDVSGHDADIFATTLNVGGTIRTANQTSQFKFGNQTTGNGTGSMASVLDVTSVNIGTRVAGSTTTFSYTDSVDLSGGTVVFGNSTAGGTGVDIVNSAYDQAGAATFTSSLNISGGNVTIYNGNASFAVRIGQSTAANSGIVNASMNLTGGTTTLTGDIVRGAATGTVNSTLTLNGASAVLDMGGKNITNVGNITYTDGLLKNLGTVNTGMTLAGTGSRVFDQVGNGAIQGAITGSGIGLTKQGSGILTLSGNNTFSGATLVSAGTLALSGAGEINGSGNVTINGSGAKLLQTSSVAVNPVVTLTQGTLTGSGTVNTVNVADSINAVISNNNGVGGAALTIGNLTLLGAADLNLFSLGGNTSSTLDVTGTLSTAGTAATLTANNAGGWTNGSTYTILTFGGGSISGSGDNFTKVINNLATRQSGNWTTTGSAITLAFTGDNPVWSGANGGNWTTEPTNSATSATPNWALKNGLTATDFWLSDSVEFNDTYNIGGNITAPVTTTVNISTADVSPNSAIFNNSAVDYTLTGAFGIANGTLTKNGTGNLTITNVNTYTGTTSVNAGTLALSGAGTAGAAGSQLDVNGGTLDLGGTTQTKSGVVRFLSGTTANGTITKSGAAFDGQAGSVSAVLDGAVGLAKTTGGTLTLSANNTYTGTTTITAGTLSVNTIGNGGVASALGNATSAAGNLVFDGGTLQYTGANATSDRAFTINAGKTATIDNAAGSNISFVGANGTATTGALTKTGNGTLTLTGNSTYTGKTSVNAGTLQLNGGRLGNGTYAGALDIASGATFENAGSPSQTLSGVVGIGGGTLTNSGTGQLILSNAGNAYGTLNIGGGRVFINTSTAALPAAATVNVSGGLLVFGTSGTYSQAIAVSSGAGIAARAATTLGNVTLPGSGTVNFNNDDSATSTLAITNSQALTGNLTIEMGGSRTLAAAIGNVTLSGNITGAAGAGLTLAAGNGNRTDFRLILSGNNSYTGTTSVNAGTLALSGAGTAGDAASQLDVNGGTLDLGGTTQTKSGVVRFLSGTTQNGTITKSGADYDGQAGNVSAVLDGAVGLAKTTGGTLILSGNNTYTGNTTINGGTLQMASNLIQNSPNIFIGNGATVTTNSGTLGISLTAGQTITGTGATGFFTTGTNGLVMNGNNSISNTAGGNLTLVRLNVQAGNNTISQGNIIATGGSARGVAIANGGTATLTISSGASFTSTGATINDFVGANNGNGTLIIDGGSYTNTAGVGLALGTANGPTAGNGTFTLTSGSATIKTLDFSGRTANTQILNLDGGTLTVNAITTTGNGTKTFNFNGGNLTASGNFTLGNMTTVNVKNGGANINTNGNDVTISDALLNAGTGGLTKTGLGNLTLTGNNTYTGTTTVSNGTLALSGGNNILADTNAVNIDNAAGIFDISGITTSETIGSLAGVAGSSVVLGSKNLTVGDATNTTFAGGITGTNGTLTKQGAGTLTLTGNNTYSGTTTITQGALVINGAVASTSVVVDGSLQGSGAAASATFSGSGSIDPGNSPGILTGAAADPTGGLDFNFEFTAANTMPTWSNATASGNDVLRLTDGTAPFTASLGGTNTVTIYFNVGSLSLSDVFNGGFYTDKNTDFLTSISSGTFQYFLADVGGNTTYMGNTYSAYTGPYTINVSTFQVANADFAGGNVTGGYVSRFTVVPEPRAALLGGLGLLALLRRRRN